MDKIQRDLSPTMLITAIEENLASLMSFVGVLGVLKTNDPPGVDKVVCSIPMPMFNSIMNTHIRDENVEEAIKFITIDAIKRNTPVLWWTGPSTQPKNLGEHLLEHGFKVDEDGPGMAVELSLLKEDIPKPQGMKIQAVDDDASLWIWCKTTMSGFEAPPDRLDFGATAWHDLISRVNSVDLLPYLAWFDEKPVATSLLAIGGGVAGIYAVATIPEARRKGIGAQVTLQPLLDARQRGYKVGILQSSQMGLGLYRALGFKEYCRIKSYIYRPQVV